MGLSLENLRESLPEEMLGIKRWCIWGRVSDGENQDKKPYSPKTGVVIDLTRGDDLDELLTDFEAAAKWVEESEFEGIGFYPSSKYMYAIIDIDDCCAEDGTINKRGRAFTSSFPSYTEKSMSGTGLHIVLKLTSRPAIFDKSEKYIYKDANKNNFAEIFFNSKNFVALTGDLLPYNRTVVSVSAESFDIGVSYVFQMMKSKSISEVQEGNRDNTLFAMACQLLKASNDLDLVFAALQQKNKFCVPPVSDEDLERIMASAARTAVRSQTLSIDVETGTFIRPNEEDAPDYAAFYNKNHYAILLEGKFFIGRVSKDAYTGQDKHELMSPSDFFNMYAADNTTTISDGKPRTVNRAKAWFESPHRRQYDGYVFEESSTRFPTYLNKYTGMAKIPEPGRCGKFLEHIYRNICNKNKHHYRYVLKWMAYAVQNPTKPGQVALVLLGERGTGKSFFVRNFGALFGNHFRTMASGDSVSDKFNANLEEACLLFLDEAVFAADIKDENKMKALITEETIMIEEKFQKKREVRNHLSIIMATNNDWAAPVGPYERRYFSLKVGKERRRDSKYFRAIQAELESGGYEALLYLLQNINVGFDDIVDYPESSGNEKQARESLEDFSAWWYESLDLGYIQSPKQGENPWNRLIARTEVYEKYTKHARSLGKRYVLPMPKFYEKLLDHSPERMRKANITRKIIIDRQYDRSTGDFTERCVPAFEFMDLKECRKLFNQIYKVREEGWVESADKVITQYLSVRIPGTKTPEETEANF